MPRDVRPPRRTERGSGGHALSLVLQIARTAGIPQTTPSASTLAFAANNLQAATPP